MSIDISSSVSIAKRRLNDLQSFQLPRLRQCKGPIGLFREIADEMKSDIEGVRRSIEMSRELAESEDEREKWLDQVDELERDLQSIRTEYRDALVQSKRAITDQARSRHHELLIERSNSGAKEEPAVDTLKANSRVGTSEDDALQTKTNEVTDALRRTTTMMQAELERSVLSVQMLDESTKTLQLTQTLYDNYTSLLNTSTHLVKAIERADWYDRLLILAAFILFLLVVGWVLKRRVLDKVVGGVGWWVGGSWRLLRMGVGKGKSAGGVGKEAKIETVRMVRAVTHAAESAVKGTAIVAPMAGAAASVAAIAKGGPADVKGENERTSDTPSQGMIDDIAPTDSASSAVTEVDAANPKPEALAVRDEL